MRFCTEPLQRETAVFSPSLRGQPALVCVPLRFSPPLLRAFSHVFTVHVHFYARFFLCAPGFSPRPAACCRAARGSAVSAQRETPQEVRRFPGFTRVFPLPAALSRPNSAPRFSRVFSRFFAFPESFSSIRFPFYSAFPPSFPCCAPSRGRAVSDGMLKKRVSAGLPEACLSRGSIKSGPFPEQEREDPAEESALTLSLRYGILQTYRMIIQGGRCHALL